MVYWFLELKVKGAGRNELIRGEGRNMKSRIVMVGVFLGLCWSSAAFGLSVEGQVDLMLNSLRFDQGMNARLAGGLKIGVLSLRGNPGNRKLAMQAEQAFQTLGSQKFKGQSVQVLLVQAATPEELIEAMVDQGLDLIFICPTPEECMKKILAAASRDKVLALAADADSVAAGAALAVVDRAGKPRILLNVDAARSQGARFKTSFMRMAECVSSGGQLKAVYQHPALVEKRKLRGDDPVYPKIARLAKKEATVVAKLTIAPDGSISGIKFIKTDKLFEPAVTAALQTWRFKPHQVAGRAVPTYTVMNFKFNLN